MKTQMPLIAVDCPNGEVGRHSKKTLVRATIDSRSIARIAANHLASRGFHRLAFLGSPECDWSDLQSWGSECKSMSISPPYILNSVESAKRGTQILRSLELWVKRLPKPTAILACDDRRGFQVLEACRSAGINVPNEIAVMGVGNDELLCELASPTLSSVSLSAVEGGHVIAQALDRLMQEATVVPAEVVIQPCGLVVRSSTDVDISQDPHVSAARSIIHGRCTQEVSIEALAKSVGVSRRTLELKFRKYAGRTVFDEIQEARLSKAKVILKETEIPISRVAFSSGYRSVAYFIRVFGKEIGLTPAKYRMASRASEARRNGDKGIWRLAE
jgi:LacI family transcriptional regulator